MSSGHGSRKNDPAARLQIANRLPRLALLSTLVVAGTLGAVVVWPAMSRAGRVTATAGPVSNHHRLIEEKCESCHARPFRGATDVQCTTCHRVGEHATAMPRMLATHPERSLKCASCHKEHHGLRSLVPTDSPLCTACHAQIESLVPSTREPAIGSFARHPEFAALTRAKALAGPGDPSTRGLHDTTPLKFSHAEHLQPHPGTVHPEPLVCQSCHEPVADQTTMQPIAFEKHCHGCHELALDGRLEGVRVPHGSPDRALATIRAELSRVYMEAPVLDAGVPKADGGALPVPSQDDLEAEVLDLELALYTGHNGCEKCHDLAEAPPAPGKSRHAVVEPKIPKTWMPASRYAHGPHRTTPCRFCHDSAEHSTTAGDVLIPGIARCRECHGDPGTPGKVESPCLECHRYHREERGL
jgi:hypothetical protein